MWLNFWFLFNLFVDIDAIYVITDYVHFSHHWELKKKFMEHHKDRFPEDALVSTTLFAPFLMFPFSPFPGKKQLIQLNLLHRSGGACSDIR